MNVARRGGSSILWVLLALGGTPTVHAETPATARGQLRSPRLYVLDCGRLTSDSAEEYGLAPNEVADTSMADPCFLVMHPRGVLLFDTGLPDRLAGHPTKLEGYGLEVNTPLRAQLAAIGVAPADVTYLALSHSHFDHIGNAPDFAGATWIAQKAELDAVFGPGAREPPPPELQALAHARKRVIRGDHDVFGDGTVVVKFTPGHTPGHQSLFLKLAKTGPIVLSGDLYHYPEERSLGIVPGFDVNGEQTKKSRADLEAFLKKSGAKLWIQHSTADNAKLKKAPEYYE